MKNKYILSLLLVASSICFCGCTRYVSEEIFDAQVAEYDRAMKELQTAYNEVLKENSELEHELAQANADLGAYKDAIDKVNEERRAKNEAEDKKLKDAEDAWNALTDAQKKAVTEGAERSRMTTYLIRNNEEYAEIYQYMLDLENNETITLESKEFKVYTEKKKRKFEIEKEYKASLETQ